MKEKDCILVIDDDEGTRKSLTLLLKRKGFEIDQAETGKEALAIAQGRLINLTLLDIKLPDIEGIQLLAPLKKTNPDMSIIMITGFASVESAVQSLTAGASGYITKPIDLDEMLARIKNTLEHQHLVSEVRRAEEALKISLAKYQVLFESFPLAITISDKMGNIVESNRRAEEILGLSPEEQSKRKIDGTEWQLIRSDGTLMPADEYASVRALKENRRVQNVEMGIVKGHSAVTWISVTAAPIPLKDYGVAIAYSDITDRKKAEQELLENELKFRELFDNMSSGVAIYKANKDGNDFLFKNLNRAGERIDNLKSQDIIGKSLLGIFPAIKEFGLFDILQRVWQTGVPESHPASLYKDARITGWRENYVYRLPTGEVVSVYEDVTERIQADGKLRESETYLKTIFNSAQIGLLIIDPVTHSIYDINPAALELVRRTRNEIIGTTCHEFICPAERGKCPITDLGQKIDHAERILLRADGKRVPIFKTVVPIVIQDRTYLLESFVDITERKEAEEKLQHFNEELELAVKERTDRLNKSLHEKEILLKEIHHRVKNNLQIIISLLRLQKIQVTDMATQQQILDSESRIRSMALVHEKLYRSTTLSSINFDDYIKTLVHQLISLYTINPGQVRIVIDLKEISVDINQAIPLGLIMNELISNAMKYAFPEGRKGELSVSGMQQGGSYVFTIRDNGAGIPQDFNWRETKTLGMHLVIMLTDQLNGTIELEKGAGTSFRLTIPEKT